MKHLINAFKKNNIFDNNKKLTRREMKPRKKMMKTQQHLQ